MKPRISAAALVAAYLLAACSGASTNSTLPATPKAHPHEVYQTACNGQPGQTEGQITEYSIPTTNSEPWGVAVTGGNVYFSEYNGNAIGELTPSTSTFSRYTFSGSGNDPRDITVNADGNVYAMLATTIDIGKLNVSTGTTSLVPTYVDRIVHWGLNTVPSGANAGMWITDSGADKLIHHNTSGALAGEVTTSSHTIADTADSSGNLWFMQTNGTVGKLSTTGTKTYYTAAVTNAQGMQMTEGPNNTGIWYPQQSSNEIVNVSPAGAVTTYTIPTAASQPYGIVAACNKLWVAEYATDKIAEFDPSTNNWTEYNVPTASAKPFQMAVDANGQVWFTEWAANKVAMIATVSGGPQPSAAVYALNGVPVNGVDGLIAGWAANHLFAPATTTLSGLPNATVDMGGAMTFDQAGDLWVAYQAADGPSGNMYGIAEYAPGATTPTRSILPTNPISSASGVGVDPSGNVYLSDGNGAAIYEYAAGSSGNQAPINTISGTDTHLGGNGRMVVDNSGDIFVAANYGLLMFYPGDSGDHAPDMMWYDQLSNQTCFGGNPPGSIRGVGVDAMNYVVVALDDSATPTIPNMLWFNTNAGSGSCAEKKGQLMMNNGAVTDDVAFDDNGFVYGLQRGSSAIYVFNESDVWAAFPNTDASPVATISGDASLSDYAVALATWPNGLHNIGSKVRRPSAGKVRPHHRH